MVDSGWAASQEQAVSGACDQATRTALPDARIEPQNGTKRVRVIPN
jgi:hypothetical protein